MIREGYQRRGSEPSSWVPASYCGSRVPGISVVLALGVWGERLHWHWECGMGTYAETHWLSSSTGVEG
eukprot:4044947-Prymnesium_polylepis.1